MAQVSETFECFQELPTELRLQIWAHYFDKPRIHINKNTLPQLNCLHILDAETNRLLSSKQLAAGILINREAYQVFRETLEVVSMAEIYEPSSGVVRRSLATINVADVPEEAIPPENETADIPPRLSQLLSELEEDDRKSAPSTLVVNWNRDLIYLWEAPPSFRMLLQGKWAPRARRVALVIKQKPASEWEFDPAYWRDDLLMREKVDCPTTLRQVILVLAWSGGDDKPEHHDGQERDEYGFAPFGVLESLVGAEEYAQITRHFAGVAQVIREAFPHLDRPEGIRWAVDIAYAGIRNAKYTRRLM
ncbi:hypothetical protein NKR19_g8763 [Coniochaeta hoffmannii]|uniref:2EXR domain-containing protein n=1 Tax=Coniochaeta hoffmannii TaxID=91930 RepID=A0AA38R382_9PEZI|nr:hypothetical protein NKR19_g8763 [Coniochaeta hoffmannii]